MLSTSTNRLKSRAADKGYHLDGPRETTIPASKRLDSWLKLAKTAIRGSNCRANLFIPGRRNVGGALAWSSDAAAERTVSLCCGRFVRLETIPISIHHLASWWRRTSTTPCAGRESDGDQQFVQTLSQQLGLTMEVGRSEGSDSDESTLRHARLDFLQTTAQKCGARYVALAHSCDDNVETVLHHLMRGTGPVGLAGIRSSRPLGQDLVLVRPFLTIRRQQIRQALESIGQAWREDSSNTNTHYRRNWIRHELLPMIESQYPNPTDAIARAIDGQRAWCHTIDRLARSWLDQHCIRRDPVQLKHDRQADEPVLVASLQHLWSVNNWPQGAMSRRHWLRLSATIRQDREDRYTLPGGIDVEASGELVELKRTYWERQMRASQ